MRGLPRDIPVTITGYMIFEDGTATWVDDQVAYATAGHAYGAASAAERHTLLGDHLAGPIRRYENITVFTVMHSTDPRWIDVLNMAIRDNTRKV